VEKNLFVTNQGGIEPPGFLTECLIFKFVCSFPPVANQNPCLDNGERNDTSNHPRMLTGVARLVGYCTHEPVEPIDRVEGGAVVVVDGGAVAWGQLRSLKSQDLPLSLLAVTLLSHLIIFLVRSALVPATRFRNSKHRFNPSG